MCIIIGQSDHHFGGGSMPRKVKGKKSSASSVVKQITPSDALNAHIKSLWKIDRSTNYGKVVGKISKLLTETINDEDERRQLINEHNLLAQLSEHFFRVFERLTGPDFRLCCKLFGQLVASEPHLFVQSLNKDLLLVFALQEKIELLHKDMATMPLTRQTTIIQKGGWLSLIQEKLEQAITTKLCNAMQKLPQSLNGDFGIKSVIMPHSPEEHRGIYTFLQHNAGKTTDIEQLTITSTEGDFESYPVDEPKASEIRKIIEGGSSFEPVILMAQDQFENSWSISERNIVCNPAQDNQVVFRFGDLEGNEAIYKKTIELLEAKGVHFTKETNEVGSQLIRIIRVDEAQSSFVHDTIILSGDILLRGKGGAHAAPAESAHDAEAEGCAPAPSSHGLLAHKAPVVTQSLGVVAHQPPS